MRVVSVSVLFSVFHISFLNAGKLYYPNPAIIDDVPVQYIPPPDIYSPYEATVYPTWEYLQWIPLENIPYIGDESAYYYYPNHKHIGSTIPCPKKGHTTKKPYIAPKVPTTTTTTTTPRPTPHKVHSKGSAVGIKTSFNELELKLNQLKLALSKFARAEGLDYDVEDDARTLPVSSETNEGSKVEGKEEVVEEQPKQEMEEQSKSELEITQDVGQEETIVQEEDNFRADNNEDLDDMHLLEEMRKLMIDNTLTRKEANADQKANANQDVNADPEENADEQETEIHLVPEHREEASSEDVVRWLKGLNQDLLRNLPLDDRYFQNGYKGLTNSYNEEIN
ncbi:uncharacterized protein LOC126570908 [Anopheles aquasalis]|uniref:uncharacterized protein LOC126570908 n=1 Tax=Anopheles aquasalis TaxID=42839 RepID=UPI00215A4220|nr:uncharacterized protein LOC126570908 [Anopheles aquasalis]